MDNRPDPDELLVQLQAEAPSRGRLKIYLGYAAGVGKTFAMLEAAHQRNKQGVDVVAGFVETHGRIETESLLSGLQLLPRLQVEYHGVILTELDVDAVLKRRPALVLVDEFAHTNAPGSRHPKRYMDVEEILDSGIDVYTTLNIQHLESLNDVVAQVTGVVVRETVPDRMLDEASEIEVIDLPPDELLSRLQEGKVYIPEQARRAIQKFFRKGNLTALRELALRRTAERVDVQMRAYMRTQAIPGPWPATERLLVCISPSAMAEKLIRTTRHLADQINAEWFAVYVELSTHPELNQTQRERIGKTMQLAEELGAHTRTLAGRSIPEAVLAYARSNNITKIVVGKPLKPRWQELVKGSVVDQLVYASGDIDVYVISSQPDARPAVLPAVWQPHQPWGRYLAGVGLVILTTLLGLAVRGNLEPANLAMLYLAGTVIAAIYLGRGPSLLVTILGVLAFDYFLVPPYMTLAVSDSEYLLTFTAFLVVSLVVSTLTARVREQGEAALLREAHTSALYSLGRDLTSATDLHQVIEIIIVHIHQAFDGEVAIFMPDNGHLQVMGSTPGYTPDTSDLGVAAWAFEHDQPAGSGTDTLPAVSLRCQPLKTAHGLVGVLGLRLKEKAGLLSPEQRESFNAFCHQAALALERASLAEQAHQAELLQATEKLQTALLNSISHDLRTPLVSITGALSSLREETSHLNQEDRDTLIDTAYGEAERLNRLVGNLLNMTRLEAGAIHLNRQPCDVQDAIGSALEELEGRLGDRQIKIDVPTDTPLISFDFALVVQVLVNLLDNAVKYSAPDTRIDVIVSSSPDAVRIQVCDRGIGIPTDDLERVFDKFYRVQRPDSVSGTGLGLAIAKGIIEAHGGSIQASNRPGGGTVISLWLLQEGVE